jgi:hypothetical protein
MWRGKLPPKKIAVKSLQTDATSQKITMYIRCTPASYTDVINPEEETRREIYQICMGNMTK